MTAIRNKVKPDTVLKNFWRDNQRFADVFNTVLFNGKQVLKPEDLKEADTDISSVIKFNNHAETVQRILDVVRKTADGTDFIIWSLENQEKIHYAMPLRHMIADALIYLKEYNELSARNKREKNYSSSGEFLSGLTKTDRLHPVIGLCIYYGEEEWDGPTMGLLLMIGAGIVNAVLDYVLIVICDMGVAGAALATGIGQCIPAIAGLVFFMFSQGELRFTGFKLSLRELGHACYNGSSEMVSELSNSVVTVLFNLVLMRLAGEAGVAAISILLYGQFLFNAFYLGFTIGISPIVGFQYGAKDKKKLRSIYKIAFLFVAVSAVILTVIAEVLATWIITVFTHDPATFELAEIGFKIFAINFLFSGLNITSSGFFTALSNGKVSAIISFSRTFIFTVLSLLILPHFLKIYGAWLAVPIAEAVTLLVTVPFHKVYFIGKGEKNYLRG